MGKLEKIKDTIKKYMPALKEKYKIKLIGIFGSYVREENKKGSDLDILVEFSTPPDLFKFINLENYLSDLLRVKVDLVTRAALKPLIKDQILKEAAYL